MFRPKYVFDVILDVIKDHEVFTNNSNVPQTPVDQQLAVALYRLGRYGNAASLEDVAWVAGCSEGSVENFTNRVFTAIESLHDTFVRPLTPEEKEAEKVWMDISISGSRACGGRVGLCTMGQLLSFMQSLV